MVIIRVCLASFRAVSKTFGFFKLTIHRLLITKPIKYQQFLPLAHIMLNTRYWFFVSRMCH